MSTYIAKFDKGTSEYEKLQIVALMLTNRSPLKYRYEVGETYFDFGQDWMWTTILCRGNEWGGYQALNPREQEEILEAETYADFVRIVNEILADDLCPDKTLRQ